MSEPIIIAEYRQMKIASPWVGMTVSFANGEQWVIQNLGEQHMVLVPISVWNARQRKP